MTSLGTQPSHDVKSSIVDPVTEFDRAAEQHIVAGLIAARPDDAIVGEEGADRPGTSGIEWHVDPIDGTVNFLYDLPGWSTSIFGSMTRRTSMSKVTVAFELVR